MTPLSTPNDYMQELLAMSSAEAKRQWRRDIKAAFNNQCVYCGSTENLTIDHVKPKALGGRDQVSNLVCSCRRCNQSKGSQHWLEWWVAQETFNTQNLSLVLSHIS